MTTTRVNDFDAPVPMCTTPISAYLPVSAPTPIAFDFDAALADAQGTFTRAATVLSHQDRIVDDLAHRLDQAMRAQAELQREYDQAATEEETLMAYLGESYDYPMANESPCTEYGD